MKYKYLCNSCGIESISDTPFEVKVDEWSLDEGDSDIYKGVTSPEVEMKNYMTRVPYCTYESPLPPIPADPMRVDD